MLPCPSCSASVSASCLPVEVGERDHFSQGCLRHIQLVWCAPVGRTISFSFHSEVENLPDIRRCAAICLSREGVN